MAIKGSHLSEEHKEKLRKYTRFETTCPYCGETYMRDERGKQFCSRRCSSFARAKDWENIPLSIRQAKRASVQVNLTLNKCETCGINFIPGYHAQRFCSIPCIKKRRGYKLSEESRKNISESRMGIEPWNKGLTKETENRIASGFKPWNKGIKTGIEPWNKGIKTGIEPWNKGIKTPLTFYEKLIIWLKNLLKSFLSLLRK